MNNLDSSCTIRLLDELEALGFNDDAFARLHHFWQRPDEHPGRRSTINSHRLYCHRTTHFRPDGNNARLQRRLEVVLERYRQGGFDNPSAFHALADASVALIPFRPFSTPSNT
jgi:hypothetical protein